MTELELNRSGEGADVAQKNPNFPSCPGLCPDLLMAYDSDRKRASQPRSQRAIAAIVLYSAH
jgi:hypothetical protein